MNENKLTSYDDLTKWKINSDSNLASLCSASENRTRSPQSIVCVKFSLLVPGGMMLVMVEGPLEEHETDGNQRIVITSPQTSASCVSTKHESSSPALGWLSHCRDEGTTAYIRNLNSVVKNWSSVSDAGQAPRSHLLFCLFVLIFVLRVKVWKMSIIQITTIIRYSTCTWTFPLFTQPNNLNKTINLI